MTYQHMQPGIFISRPNRFIAYVDIDGKEQACHVMNTGRLGELLRPGVCVLVQRSGNPQRKTAYSLVSVYKGTQLVNIDSQAPNHLFAEWLSANKPWGEMTAVKPESKWGSSRFDFHILTPAQSIYVEVKGITLERGGVAMFPDAPTKRGLKHVNELIQCKRQGHHAAIAFIIQMKGVHAFRPNDEMQPEFGASLREAAKKGVQLIALDCIVKKGTVLVDAPVPVLL